jgi:hypothetical protein
MTPPIEDGCESMGARQHIRRNVSLGAVLTVALLVTARAICAQQITGVPGSPSATVTINGKQLPPPPMKFGGVIKESYLDSKRPTSSSS